MGLLYQEIMNVPGLSGTWQDRNKALYEKLGSPQGSYTGSYSQNIWLLNQLKSNDYFKSGLPGDKPAAATAPGDNPFLNSFVDPITGKISTGDEVYSQDVMSMDEWKQPFDAWTQNFVDTYVRPEWERDVYEPAMEQMTRTINEQNQAYGNTGAWRSSASRNNMTRMAEQGVLDEEALRRDFQSQSVGIRDAMYDNLANPLYLANMSKYVTAPWREMDIEAAMKDSPNTVGGDAWQKFRDSLSAKGVTYNVARNPGEATEDIGNWNPIKGDQGFMRDWTVTPNTFGSMGTGVFNQYLGKPVAAPNRDGSLPNRLGDDYIAGTLN